jgi:hypothetical protein
MESCQLLIQIAHSGSWVGADGGEWEVPRRGTDQLLFFCAGFMWLHAKEGSEIEDTAKGGGLLCRANGVKGRGI